MILLCVLLFFFFKQKTAYEMRISDWSSDVCSSDLPAKVFLGDVGSVPLGFLLGWLLLGLAAAGHWAAALILPLYYLADATITLGCRALRREKIWQAHREHFYQRAVQRGRSHATVSRAVFGVNACLAALALASLTAPWMALVAAALVVAGLLAWMARCRRRSR